MIVIVRIQNTVRRTILVVLLQYSTVAVCKRTYCILLILVILVNNLLNIGTASKQLCVVTTNHSGTRSAVSITAMAVVVLL